MHNFKKACAATAALMVCVVLITMSYIEPYFHGTAYFYQDSKERAELAGELDTLICGASYGLRAIDPYILNEELDCNSYNLSGALQTMKGRYTLLKKEVERNDIHTVVMEVSAYALTRDREAEGIEGDIHVLARMENIPERLAYFFQNFRPSEYAEMYYDTMNRGMHTWDLMLQGNMSDDMTERGFWPVETVDMTVSQSELPTIRHQETMELEQNTESVMYFEKCLSLCRENNIRLILVATPIDDRSLLRFDGLEEIRQWYTAYAQQYDLEFYDFNLLKTKMEDYPADTAFFDRFHLSESGSQTFSKQLCSLLLRAEDGEDFSDLFYSSYDEAAQATWDILSSRK